GFQGGGGHLGFGGGGFGGGINGSFGGGFRGGFRQQNAMPQSPDVKPGIVGYQGLASDGRMGASGDQGQRQRDESGKEQNKSAAESSRPSFLQRPAAGNFNPANPDSSQRPLGLARVPPSMPHD